MGKPFFTTQIYNDGECNICPRCGKRFRCKKAEACEWWSDSEKEFGCECTDCNPVNTGTPCEETEETRTWSVS